MIGAAIIVSIVAWVLGGVLLRLLGALLILAGAVGLAVTGEVNAVLVLLLGVALWWAGQFHYALRHGAWKSPLAGRLFR